MATEHSRESDDLLLKNTLTGRRDPFRQRHADGVRLFTCGPSVYNRPHIGNYRTYLGQDILQRYLEYRGHHVLRVLNFTDVEDKAVDEAKGRGLALADLTRDNEAIFLREAQRLGIRLPGIIPRSSTSVDQAVELIRILLDKGHAYRYRGSVFFDPLTFPDFGKLFGLDLSKWPQKRIRFWRDTYPGKRWNLGDFILWHAAKRGEPGAFVWDTSLGRGRPAWNIQDPAMISQHLGYELDICCGGVDNLYRHHDYNIAVMEAVSGKELTPCWLHGEHLLVRGAKMSKSKGNIIYPEDMFRDGVSPHELRFYLLSVHYRRTMSLTDRRLARAGERWGWLQQCILSLRDRAGDAAADADAESARRLEEMRLSAERHLNDDLDVPGAVQGLERDLWQLAHESEGGRLPPGACALALRELEQIDSVLGFLGLAE
ncbi:MAG: class I tRNA ligase family protein [Desulfohalobiaceae bacterium]